MTKANGYVVLTQSGLGKTNHNDKLHNGKLPVYLTDGKKILCTPGKVKIVGYWDGTGSESITPKDYDNAEAN